MDNLKITFLGTGNAIPTVKRNHTAILCSFKNENILVDCGEGTQRQFKLAELSPMKLTRILITHWHGDHILGLPGLFQTLAMSESLKTIHLYGPKGTKQFLNLINSLTGINIKLEVHEISEGIIFENSEFKIEAKEMSHNSPAFAYSISLKDKIRIKKDKLKKLKLKNSPLIGELTRGKDITINNKKIKASQLTYTEKGKKVTFILDTKMNKNAIALAKNSDLLIAESSFSSNEKDNGEKYMHLTAFQTGQIAKEAKVNALVLTHISQRYEHTPQIIEKEAKKIFKNTKLAKDFDIFVI